MCINKPYKPVWPSKFWSFADHTQYNRNQDAWNAYKGIILNSPNVTARKENQIIIKSRAGKGFSRDMTNGYFICRSTTYASMQISLYMNYTLTFIFGLDMCEVGGMLYHYGATNPDVATANRKSRFQAESEGYDWAGNTLPEDIRKRFYMCSSYNPFGFLDKYHRVDHKIAIPLILDKVKELVP